MSVQEPSRLDCGLQGVAEDVSDEDFEAFEFLISAIYERQNKWVLCKHVAAHIHIRWFLGLAMTANHRLQLRYIKYPRTRGDGFLLR